MSSSIRQGVPLVPPVRRVVHLRDLLRELVVRDMKVRYKRSLLGMAWSLVNPLLQLGVFYFLFQVVLSLNVPRYSAYVLSGLLVWNWFQTSIRQAATTITGSRELLRLHGFPSGVLPVVAVTTNMIEFMIAIPVLAMFLFVGGNSLGMSVLLMPVVIAVQYVFTLGLSYLVATANVMFRDTQHLMDLLLRMYMFLSPVFYTMDHVPADYQDLYRLNPAVPLLEAYRAVLMAGEQPDWMGLAGVALLGGVLLVSGCLVFHRFSGRFVDEL